MIEKLKKIDAKEFTYKRHESNWWSVFGLSFTESIELDKLIDKINEYAIGYCDGSTLEIKPREKSYAVMFEVVGEKFWFHIIESENQIMQDFIERMQEND